MEFLKVTKLVERMIFNTCYWTSLLKRAFWHLVSIACQNIFILFNGLYIIEVVYEKVADNISDTNINYMFHHTSNW